MRSSITTRFEMHRRVDPASANWKDRIAGLVRPFVDTKALAAECKHLRHEGHIFKAALFVKRRQDFLRAADLHPFSGLQVESFDPAWIVHVYRVMSPVRRLNRRGVVNAKFIRM